MHRVLALMVGLAMIASAGLASAHMMTGTVKRVHGKDGTLIVTIDGKDELMTAKKKAILKGIKAGDTVEVDHVTEGNKGIVKAVTKK